MFAVHYPTFDGPLIGASGAVSGAMGAFLITNWKTKIHFFYMLSFVVRGTFSAPAWLMLPIWVLMEFFNARVMDSITPGSGGGGVAHWAHVWGFVFGAVFAAGMKYLKIEQKYINPITQAERSFVNKSYARYEEAVELRNNGKVDEAFAILKEAVQMGGADSEVIEAFWNTSLGIGKTNEAAPFFIRYIQKEIINGQLDLALQIDPALAERAITLCDNHPDIPGSKKAELKTKLASAKARKSEIEAHSGAPMPSTVDRVDSETIKIKNEPLSLSVPQNANINISVTQVMPLEMKDTVMTIKLEKVGPRALPLNKIKVISSAHITSQGERKFLLFDLFLDDPAAPPPNNVVRTVRILSLHFNARAFFPEIYNPVEAYRKFIATLIRCSNARPHPDLETARLVKVNAFPTIKAYEEALFI